ncbi:copper resistance D family protein [Psychrobacillus sp. FJAT-21963]|uniref:copper resistance D family protein n=1 Tax=Psychrobacillus sp. FJAT-21963 TaxID=1712028 RepID=UPI0006F5B9C7|nr:CopD family protein [Psychrobacillus sp. FJAT-21963]KQL34682.1 copper resistance protein CopD [Psychrobacillus sp. FJAT-21963]
MLMTVVSEVLLYLCFSILIGSFLISLVPSSFKPEILVQRRVQIIATVGIALFSFIPILLLVLQLDQEENFVGTLQMVLNTFEIGKAWFFTFIVANMLFIFLLWFDDQKNQLYAYGGLAFTFLLILGFGWASHASSVGYIKGFIIHTSHFTAVTVWVGILLVVSWFSKGFSNWLKFLKWFSPVAIVCFIITIASGIGLMTFVMDFATYTDTWMLSYGQLLLIKHLFIIPLIVYAAINSLFVKKKLIKYPNFNPRPWSKIESLIILLIFSVTAALSNQSPPSENTFKNEGPSRLFSYFYQGQNLQVMHVELAFNATGFSLFVLSILLIGLTIYAFLKKAPALITFFLSILFVFSSYLALILSIT